MTHREALELLRKCCHDAEGCPVSGCDCSPDRCAVAEVLETGEQACADQETLQRQVRGALGMFMGH